MIVRLALFLISPRCMKGKAVGPISESTFIQFLTGTLSFRDVITKSLDGVIKVRQKIK